MSVELKVTLVGEDPRQQEAFNNPASVLPSAASSQQIPTPQPVNAASRRVDSEPFTPAKSQTPPKGPPPVAPFDPIPPATKQAKPDSLGPLTLPTASNSDGKLIDSIEELIQSIDELTRVNIDSLKPSSARGSGASSKQTAPQASWFEKIAAKIDEKLESWGLSTSSGLGNVASSMVHGLASVGTRVSRVATSAFGPAASTAAGTARTAATVAGAAGTGAGAAGTAATTASAGVAGTAAGTATAGAGAAGVGAGTAATATAATLAAPLLGPLAVVAVAAAGTAISLKLLNDVVTHVAKDLEDFSPDLTTTRARHDVNKELATLDRAQRIGPELATLTAAQNRINESMYEVQTKIYEILLKGAPIAEKLLDAVNVLVRAGDLYIATLSQKAAKATFWDWEDDKKADKQWLDAAFALAKAVSAFKDGQDDKAGRGIDPMFQEFLDSPIDPVVAPNPPKRRP